jgi:hypothetical protein
LEALRGKRMRLFFRIKDEGAARTFAAFTIHNADKTDIVFPPQAQEPDMKGWDDYEIVADVPGNANDLELVLTLKVTKGRATSWVDDVRLEAVDDKVPVTDGTRTVAHHQTSDSWLNSTY